VGIADHRLLTLLIATIVLGSPLVGNAQDKHALVQKLFEVSDVSNQIKEGALAATPPIMAHIRKNSIQIFPKIRSTISKARYRLNYRPKWRLS
jgi:hypothetical protein